MTLTGSRHGSAVVTLPSAHEILITRVFDAPADLVFRAWTTPELVRRWWGWDSSALIVCDIDLRVGGDWRYVTREADGRELAWYGTYYEIDAPGRLVSSEVFEGHPDAATRNTLTLTERGDGTTLLEVLVVHTSTEHRDGHLASGMETGMQHSVDRLEDLVVRLAAEPGAEEGR